MKQSSLENPIFILLSVNQLSDPGGAGRPRDGAHAYEFREKVKNQAGLHENWMKTHKKLDFGL